MRTPASTAFQRRAGGAHAALSNAARLAGLLLAAALAGCASRPHYGRDGPDPRPPPNLDRVPDAVPRIEPLRSGGPNQPYEMMGRRHVPLTADLPLRETGLASWYGRKFHGQSTASGEPYDMYAMTAAHRTMPIPSYARVRNPANGREVIVRINDRGPFEGERVIDLSYTAAFKLGLLSGVAPVQVQRLTFDDIRSGAWQRAPADPLPAALPPAPPAPPPDLPAAGLAAALAALPPDDPAPGETLVTATGTFWLQLGAWRNRDAALQMQQRIVRDGGNLPAVVVLDAADGWFRVQAGPWAARSQALEAGERLQRLRGWAALVVERAAAPPGTGTGTGAAPGR